MAKNIIEIDDMFELTKPAHGSDLKEEDQDA